MRHWEFPAGNVCTWKYCFPVARWVLRETLYALRQSKFYTMQKRILGNVGTPAFAQTLRLQPYLVWWLRSAIVHMCSWLFWIVSVESLFATAHDIIFSEKEFTTRNCGKSYYAPHIAHIILIGGLPVLNVSRFFPNNCASRMSEDSWGGKCFLGECQ